MKPQSSTAVTLGSRGIPWSSSWPITTISFGLFSGVTRSSQSVSLAGLTIERLTSYRIFPANLFVTTRERINRAVDEILVDLGKQVEFFRSIDKPLEAKRLYERVTYDVEMIKEIGYCSGIENYSRYFDGRAPGTALPARLLDDY